MFIHVFILVVRCRCLLSCVLMHCSSIHFGSWNLRGLNDPIKQKAAKDFLNKNQLSLIGLIEHKIKTPNIRRITNYICPHWQTTDNSVHAPIGRILLAWNPAVLTITVLTKASQFIHCHVHAIQEGHDFLVTFVYGANDHVERRDLWKDLLSLYSALPWVVLGDFNVVRNPNEKVGGNNHWTHCLDEFNDCLYSCELYDLRFTGSYYTWTNRQDSPNFISSKLDRVLVNDSWNREHTFSAAFFPTPGISDHSPALVHITPPPRSAPKPFKFFDFLADHPLFIPTVQGIWRRIIIGNPMYCMYAKPQILQVELRKLNKQEFSAISERVAQSQSYLESLQEKLGRQPADSRVQREEKIAYKQFLTLSRAEESLARQKSRINWMKLGDQCTSFFFKSVNSNRNRNKLTSLTLSDSSITHDVAVIKDAFVNFYTELLGRPHNTQYSGYDRVNQLISRRLTYAQSLAMVHEVSDLEIKETMWELNPHKAPGFVKGRRIADNIFLTQELMRGYHKSSPSPRCALKVDIMKAYDNVRWDLLWDILKSMNFHPKMIKWIQSCVTTTNYFLSINGEPTGYIKGRKGLRQGDPLSSYLFVIVMEVLTSILREKANLPDFHFHWRCSNTKLINLCFADDLMIFSKGDLVSVKHIHASLLEFEALSGLSPSPGKSSAFFSGVDHSTREGILAVLGFKEGFLPVKYLGVPLLSTKLKHQDCKNMVARITSRTKTWTNRDLTYAGRVQLIKNVLFSM